MRIIIISIMIFIFSGLAYSAQYAPGIDGLRVANMEVGKVDIRTRYINYHSDKYKDGEGKKSEIDYDYYIGLFTKICG